MFQIFMLFITDIDIFKFYERRDNYVFYGGSHNITEEELNSSIVFECDGWNELYNIKHYCPLEVNIRYSEV